MSYRLSLLLSLFLSFFILESVLALAAQGETKCNFCLFETQHCSNAVYTECVMLSQFSGMTCAHLQACTK